MDLDHTKTISPSKIWPNPNGDGKCGMRGGGGSGKKEGTKEGRRE